jgi:hypothetical protein
MDPERIVLTNGEAKGLRLHLTVRDAVAIGIMLVSLTGVWYSLKSSIAAYGEKMQAHLDDPYIHPGVLARQALIHEELVVSQRGEEAAFRRIEQQIADLRTDIKETQRTISRYK